MRNCQILGNFVLVPTYYQAYWNIHFSRQNCDGLSETPIRAITLPSFAHHVGQSALSSYTKRDLYGDVLLHTSSLPVHAAFHLFTQSITLNTFIWCSRFTTIALLPCFQDFAVHLLLVLCASFQVRKLQCGPVHRNRHHYAEIFPWLRLLSYHHCYDTSPPHLTTVVLRSPCSVLIAIIA